MSSRKARKQDPVRKAELAARRERCEARNALHRSLAEQTRNMHLPPKLTLKIIRKGLEDRNPCRHVPMCKGGHRPPNFVEPKEA